MEQQVENSMYGLNTRFELTEERVLKVEDVSSKDLV